MHWGNGISQKNQQESHCPKLWCHFFGKGKLPNLLKLLKLVGQIVMLPRVWWWEAQALGAGETEKGSSMDAVGECPVDPTSPRSIHNFLVWIWEFCQHEVFRSGSWIVQLPCIGVFFTGRLPGGLQFDTLYLTKRLQHMICTMCTA